MKAKDSIREVLCSPKMIQAGGTAIALNAILKTAETSPSKARTQLNEVLHLIPDELGSLVVAVRDSISGREGRSCLLN